ncbi:XylR family transcriptional regulator [Glaciecola sp. SC05]|uniref:XylR family transcriptional regulator n=1 Tax=Glaciecola sp. SC05 TaxID=1987355 RepID=UPI003527ECD9
MPAFHRHRISLLFNANKVYDRQIIEGIGHYLQSSKVSWDVYLEEDCLARLNYLKDWDVDGIIADYDDPSIQQALQPLTLPIVGTGGSYQDTSLYPPVPFVATDNYAIVDTAFEHLKQKGLQHFAFYGLPQNKNHRWAQERENAMADVCNKNGFKCSMYQGQETRPETWLYSMNRLADWLTSLPLPVGIVAVTDARARHLVQTCDKIGLLVPDQVSIVGIDDDDIARNLSRVSLSSVSQGCFEIGFKAAKLLHKRLQQKRSGIDTSARTPIRMLVPPIGVVQRQSTDFKALQDPYVIQAMYFIRQYAHSGIKVDQVLDYVGISRSNLEQRFVQECGHTIHTQIHNEKLSGACKLLEQNHIPLASVAKRAGYPSLPYMYAIFKKHFDLTPKQYRLQLSKTND